MAVQLQDVLIVVILQHGVRSDTVNAQDRMSRSALCTKWETDVTPYAHAAGRFLACSPVIDAFGCS